MVLFAEDHTEMVMQQCCNSIAILCATMESAMMVTINIMCHQSARDFFLQEMGFDSIPFEEPELFRARSGQEAKDKVVDRQDSMLHLRLDSQDDLGSSLAEVGTKLLTSCHCTATCLAALPTNPNTCFLCAWCKACVNLSGTASK